MMLRLTWNVLCGKHKKYRTLLFCVAVCLFFTMAVDTMYRGYCDAQIENAYDYGGHWDVSIRISGKNLEKYLELTDGSMKLIGRNTATWSLKLDSVPENVKSGRAYITNYYLSLMGIRCEEENMLPYHLKEGHWPENEQELVIPYTIEIGGRSPKNGSLKLGERLSLECGRRIDADGNCTQAQVKGEESFLSEGDKEYTVCGFIDYADYSTAKVVLYGYTGVSSGTDPAQEEIVLYYMLLDRNLAALKEVSERLLAQEDVLEVSTNSYLESALLLLEKSDYLRAVRYGLYLVEGMLILVSICIAGANQYQGIREDRRQVGLFCSMGAERRQIYALYCMANALVILAGFSVSFLLYYAFVGVVQLSVLSGVRNMFFKTASFSPDIRFCGIALVVFLGVLSAVTLATLRSNIPAYREQEGRRQKRKPRPEPVTGIFELAANNLRQMKFRLVLHLFIILVLLVFVPVCVLTAYSVYETAAGMTREFSADFYMMQGEDGDADALREALDRLPYVKRITRKSGGDRKAYIPTEYLGEEVVEEIKSLYPEEYYSTLFPEDNVYDTNVTVLFLDREDYKYFEELNPGKLPSYEEFSNGQNALLYAIIEMQATGERIDVGERIAARMGRITCYSFIDDAINYSLDIIDTISVGNRDIRPGYLHMSVYVPEKYHEALIMDMYDTTYYWVDGYNGSTGLLGEALQELAYRYGYHLQDNVSESSVKKDALVIQSVSIFALVAVVLTMSIAAMGVMGNLDYISRRQTYEIYRILGLERGRAFVVHLLEQMIPLLDAVIAGAVLHCLLYYTLLKGLYDYYRIGLPTLTLAYLLCIAGVVLILLANAAVITAKRYSRAVKRNRLQEETD